MVQNYFKYLYFQIHIKSKTDENELILVIKITYFGYKCFNKSDTKNSNSFYTSTFKISFTFFLNSSGLDWLYSGSPMRVYFSLSFFSMSSPV